MSDVMKIYLTSDAPAAHWGSADVTFTAGQANIHLQAGDQLRQVQQAARKLRNQGINEVALEGEIWDLHTQWAFAQGFAESFG